MAASQPSDGEPASDQQAKGVKKLMHDWGTASKQVGHEISDKGKEWKHKLFDKDKDDKNDSPTVSPSLNPSSSSAVSTSTAPSSLVQHVIPQPGQVSASTPPSTTAHPPSVRQSIFCTGCGHPVTYDLFFCENCGHPSKRCALAGEQCRSFPEVGHEFCAAHLPGSSSQPHLAVAQPAQSAPTLTSLHTAPAQQVHTTTSAQNIIAVSSSACSDCNGEGKVHRKGLILHGEKVVQCKTCKGTGITPSAIPAAVPVVSQAGLPSQQLTPPPPLPA